MPSDTRTEPDETPERPATERPAWRAPRLVRHGSIRQLTRGQASGTMADNMFGAAVGSGMN